MAKSLSQLNNQIAKLQKEADAIRSAVVARIRKEMAQHGLTADDLFGQGHSSSAVTSRRTKKKAGAAKSPKYADGLGNAWGGVGKRPTWIREALEAGRALEEFLIGATPKTAAAAPPSRKKAVAAKKARPAKKASIKKPTRTKAPRKVAAKRTARQKSPAQTESASQS